MIVDRLIAALFLTAATGVGWWRAKERSARVAKRQDFARSFHAELLTYLHSEGQDHLTYTHLLEKSPRMQRELGTAGVISYRPAASNYLVNNYPVVLNMLPEYHREMQDAFMSTTDSPRFYAQTLQEVLLRHRGELTELAISVAVGKNPIPWFVDGIRTIVGIPVSLLRQFGLLSEGTGVRISASWLWRVISGIVGLLALISSVVTITTGWTPFLKILETLVALP